MTLPQHTTREGRFRHERPVRRCRQCGKRSPGGKALCVVCAAELRWRKLTLEQHTKEGPQA